MQTEKEPQTNTSEYITRKELAARLNVTTQSLFILDKQGVIPSVKVGGTLRYNWADVECRISRTHGYTPRSQRKGGRQ